MSCDPADDGRPGAYCDMWDIMSAQNVNSIQKPRFGATGPLLNAVNMRLLGWLDDFRVHRFTGNSDSIQLRPLSRPDLPGALAIQLDDLLIEFRTNTGWDEGFGMPGVLIHKVVDQVGSMISDDQHSVVMGFPSIEFLQSGNKYAEGDATIGPYLEINVMNIDPVSPSAIVSFSRKAQEGSTVHIPLGILQWISEGIIGVSPQGKVVKVPPRPGIRDILIGVAANELAESLENPESKIALRQSSMNIIAETARKELQALNR